MLVALAVFTEMSVGQSVGWSIAMTFGRGIYSMFPLA